MNAIQSSILGMVQGLTEFLPISSSAHLILTSKFLNWPDQGLIFDIALHLGSLLAVLIYFRSYIKIFIRGKIDVLLNKKSVEANLIKKLAIATLPIIILGIFLKPLAETLFREQLFVIAITSIIWAILLFFADRMEAKTQQVKDISYKTAFLMGLAQVLAIIPGTSRSGSTITVARFLKVSRKSSAEFSMLMSIPVIFLVGLIETIDIFQTNTLESINLTSLAIGIISAFFFAILSIHFLMKLIEKTSYLPFVIYRLLLGFGIFYLVY